MNVNPISVRILCFGDSNTWGDAPIDGVPRYPVDVRWTGLLQKALSDEYEIIEEGLCGRISVMDDPKEEGRNGKTYLKPSLQTHKPIDVVILMLGTNDLKERFNLSAEQIAQNIEKLVKMTQSSESGRNGKAPKIILLSPPLVKENAKNPVDGMKGSEAKSKQLAKYYEEVAKKNGCEFIDIAQYVESSNIDGAHLEKEAHAKIAEVLTNKIKEL